MLKIEIRCSVQNARAKMSNSCLKENVTPAVPQKAAEAVVEEIAAVAAGATSSKEH